MGHQAVIIDMGDHYVLIGGDASLLRRIYAKYGDIDSVCNIDGALPTNPQKMHQLCRNKPTIMSYTLTLMVRNVC